jgi:hypothetical protein
LAEITKGAIDDFVTNPCWQEIKKRSQGIQQSLFNQILNAPLEKVEALRIEYKKIAKLLEYPKVFREDLEEEENA